MLLPIQGSCQSRFSAKKFADTVHGPASWWNFPLTFGTIRHGTGERVRTLCPLHSDTKDKDMLGKLAGAFIGQRVAGRNRGVKGALLGAGVAAVARRGFGPLAGALALGWGAKKLYERRKGRSARFPADAAPGKAPSSTRTPS
jgi:hypothetical protein